MRHISAVARRSIESQDDQWVQMARELTNNLKGKEAERQLRLVQSMAEVSDSWKAVELFIRYQAARDQLDKEWAKLAIPKLEGLKNSAQKIEKQPDDNPVSIHMEIVSRVMGFAVRWHVWDTKGEKK